MDPSFRLPPLVRQRLSLGLLIVTLVQGIASRGAAQSAPAGQAAYRGIQACVLCHNQGTMVDPLQTQEFCRLTEVAVFRNQDRHSRSFQFLVESALTQTICRKLGIADVKQERRCLSCHADWNDRHGESLPKSLEDGVSCEACHGPSSIWYDAHYRFQETGWRSKPGHAKETETAMFDMRNPVRRAEICTSCHIGDHSQGKFLSHEMYAAGHPVLPSFELATFELAMPPHWRRTNEKGNFEFREEYNRGNTPPESPLLRDVLVGGLMTLRAQLLLLVGNDSTPAASDYAQYDCQACHHELRSPAWRQLRPSSGRLGRLRLPEWSGLLAELGWEFEAADQGPLSKRMAAIEGAFTFHPLGDPGQLKSRISEPGGLAGQLRELAERLTRRQLAEEDRERSLRLLTEISEERVVDFHSARQIAWGLQVLTRETAAGVPVGFAAAVANEKPDARRLRTEADWQILQTWRGGPWRNAEEEAIGSLQAVDLLLGLELPGATTGTVEEQLGAYGDRQERMLRQIGGYHPRRFRDGIRTFRVERDSREKQALR